MRWKLSKINFFPCIYCSLDANWIIFHVWLSEKHYFVYTDARYIIASMQSILMNCYHFCPQNKWKLVQFYGKIWGLQMEIFISHFNNHWWRWFSFSTHPFSQTENQFHFNCIRKINKKKTHTFLWNKICALVLVCLFIYLFRPWNHALASGFVYIIICSYAPRI